MADKLEGETPHPPMTDDGLEQCVRCGTTFGMEDSDRPIGSELNLTYGPVVAASTGSEFETVVATEPGTECVHLWCWEEMETERRRGENHPLDQWAQT